MTALTTAQCQFCGKRVSVLDRARPMLRRHLCVGAKRHGAIKAGSVQYAVKAGAR